MRDYLFSMLSKELHCFVIDSSRYYFSRGEVLFLLQSKLVSPNMHRKGKYIYIQIHDFCLFSPIQESFHSNQDIIRIRRKGGENEQSLISEHI